MRVLAALLLLLSAAAAQGAPVANLLMACPDANAIGQATLDSCRGYAYQLPTSQLIVSSGSTTSNVWRRATDLGGADKVMVCTIPVEPGKYSSCRDATGARRIAYVRKDSIMGGGNVTVDKSGADYTDPVAAARNAFAGDTWCVAPQWPAQPCVMAIGDGVFILSETLVIGDGLAVTGAGKGATLLVADNGVEVAVSSTGQARIGGLTVVNSQAGGAQTTGLLAQGRAVQIHDAAIHVGGAARNLAMGKKSVNAVEILDSEITAVGQDSTGIETLIPGDPDAVMIVERSLISGAVRALDETEVDIGPQVRLVDSRVFGNVVYNPEHTLLDLLNTEVVGNVSAGNDDVKVKITDSHIKGNVSVGGGIAAHHLSITDTTVEGVISTDRSRPVFDGLQLSGELRLGEAIARIVRSQINTAGTAAAVFLERTTAELEQTFVQGALVAALDAASSLESSSSVLAGPVSASANALVTCTETYGADYELLSATCQ